MLGLAMTASGRDSAESFLQQGTKLLDRGHFADSVAMLTRALEQNPKDIRAYYYRALANEMVDRQAAIGDWRRFVELVAMDPESKEEVAQAQERLQALKKVPRLPDSLLPSRYVPKAGDYYQESAGSSAGLLWTQFPVKIYADSPPDKWQGALQEALAAWNDVLPLRQVPTRQEADIIMSWAALQGGRAGAEQSFRVVGKEGDRAFERLDTASIVLDNSHHWSGPQMRFTLLHELGHALGINCHSNGSKDVMVPMLHETITQTPVNLSLGSARPTSGPAQFPASDSSVHINTKLTPRDINTLIRLYNCSGPVVHLK
jgi:predicted Zn-dependent protease